jgi:hypothetical protein
MLPRDRYSSIWSSNRQTTIVFVSSLMLPYLDNYGIVFVSCDVHCLLVSQFRICVKFRM